MSLFQCEYCGCCENTALTSGHMVFQHDGLDFAGCEDRKGLRLCSACTPATHVGGEPVRRGGAWHGQFDRVFLPLGLFETNRVGNLAHKDTGCENFRKYALRVEGAI